MNATDHATTPTDADNARQARAALADLSDTEVLALAASLAYVSQHGSIRGGVKAFAYTIGSKMAGAARFQAMRLKWINNR